MRPGKACSREGDGSNNALQLRTWEPAMIHGEDPRCGRECFRHLCEIMFHINRIILLQIINNETTNLFLISATK